MGLGAYRGRCRCDLSTGYVMPCNGCVGWLGQQTGTFTKYWCPSDGTFHFDWEPCAPAQPPPPALPPTSGPTPPPTYTPTGGPTPGTILAPSVGATGVSGCGRCCGSAMSSTIPTAAMVPPSNGAAVGACVCQDTHRLKALPWWAWALGIFGALSVLRRLSNG